MPVRPPLRSALALVLALAACKSGGDGEDDETCSFSAAVSGDLAAELPGAEGLACLIQLSGDAGIDVEYVARDLAVERVGLIIEGITAGMTGDAFPATLRVFAGDGEVWASEACTVAVHTHEFTQTRELGDAYRVRGDGQCVGPLRDDVGAGAVTLGAFEFVVVVTWAR